MRVSVESDSNWRTANSAHSSTAPDGNWNLSAGVGMLTRRRNDSALKMAASAEKKGCDTGISSFTSGSNVALRICSRKPKVRKNPKTD